jgi:Spy/CpxP family protein refolding chaperone
MKSNIGMEKKLQGIILAVAIGMMAFAVAFPTPAWTQGQPADNMQVLLDKIKADKKLLVAKNLDLTESEAQGFWPIYEQYQQELANFNQRIGKLIESYAAAYRTNTLTDEKAKKLIDEYVAIEKGEAAVKAFYVPKLNQVLPPKKVARYLQIENKIRAAIKYELAGEIPLVP